MHRVLIVDDYDGWRRYLRALIERDSGYAVVAESSDGLDAIQKAALHKPDLILLDITLPRLNGIEAARRILDSDPTSNILFLSQHRGVEIVRAALETGARGYVCKSDAGRRLLWTMSAILECGAAEPANQACRHEAIFDSDGASVLDEYAEFADAALADGSALMVVIAAERREKFERALLARGVAVNAALQEGTYIPFDPQVLLSRFMIDGWPDEQRLNDTATPIIANAARNRQGELRRVVLCGEGAPGLWSAGNRQAAITLERYWDTFAQKHRIDTLCGYSFHEPHQHHLERDGDFRTLCSAHSAVRFR
jgi:DNA-binding NarL/FixJ family response regulator